MNVAALLRQLADRGVECSLDGRDVRVRGPEREVTLEILSTLQAHKGEVREALVEFGHRVAHLGTRPVAELVGHLAARGYLLRVRDDWPFLHEMASADPAGVDLAVIEALVGREPEIVAFLQRPLTEMTATELRGMGYSAGLRVLGPNDPRVPEFAPPRGCGRNGEAVL